MKMDIKSTQLLLLILLVTKINQSQPCDPPENISVTNIIELTADISWLSASGLSNVEWGMPGFRLELTL